MLAADLIHFILSWDFPMLVAPLVAFWFITKLQRRVRHAVQHSRLAMAAHLERLAHMYEECGLVPGDVEDARKLADYLAAKDAPKPRWRRAIDKRRPLERMLDREREHWQGGHACPPWK